MTFPRGQGGELQVKLGDRILRSIPATAPGVRQHVQIPIDERRGKGEASGMKQDDLRFQISGGKGAAVQISNVSIPGVLNDSMRSDPGHRWHIDTSGGGSARYVETTAFPVAVQVTPRKSQSEVEKLSLTILSSPGFDAAKDIIRTTLTVNGSLIGGPLKKGEAVTAPSCTERDVNADKLTDLICEAQLNKRKGSGDDDEIRAEAMTIHGWNIAGTAAIRAE
jgi:hypothetical protein